MIKIEEPALALNDLRVGGHVKMSRNLRIRENDKRENIVGAVSTLASTTPGGRLKSLVLNSHGAPGYLVMGEGFWKPHTGLFKQWSGMVSNIWVMACRIGSRAGLGEGERLSDELPGEVGDGFLFCQEMAVQAHCNVIASLNTQVVPGKRIPAGHVDAFEGMLLCWRMDGSVAWAKNYAMKNGE